ncbi:hypothetical protein HM1_2042 [Heliomicrobium modesticaldum Ice1]|uniref:Rubredoxin-like domain-containing protein n=1 Tax=Heliobacterium modesticaldum (strain ATCC 51547 / Ice1) TaxID=498761 RepID=B0TGA3_HELMI|nr:radical SAM protein [Heliomicrobium modesticaldum]ABZ84599.1 hypothetical protein HM1_2042 [Heliomicrobium modesticaldum Ice1]
MAIYQCAKCGEVVDKRCKPGKCPKCGAPKDELIKQEGQASGGKCCG